MYFEKKSQKSKKHNIFTFHDNRPQSCSESVVKPLLGTTDVMINRKT